MDVRHSELVERAVRLAVRQHAGQLRKGDRQPFITHPFAVALLCARAGLSDETVAAALLHDVVEDTDITVRELGVAVGETVAEIVAAVTKEDEALPWDEKAQRYLERLRSAPLEALAVAAADKIHNLFALVTAYHMEGERVEGRFNSTFEERLRAYRGVRDLVRARWPDCPLLPELDRRLEAARAALPVP